MNDLIAQAWVAAAGDFGLARPAQLDLTGAPGQLPSALPVEDTAIACAGAALLAAAALGELRGGPAARSVRLDRGQVAAAFRSERYLRVGGQPFGDGFAPLSRFWQASDGWVRTHANYPWHREALLRALGTPSGDVADVAAAVAGYSATDLEELIVAAGGIAAAVRSSADWLASPQGQASASSPLIRGGQVGDAAARHRAASTRQAKAPQAGSGQAGSGQADSGQAGFLPADGIRVLDLTRVIAGPVATRYLAALGANVLRIDSPHRPELPLHAIDGLLGKRSALADFGTRDGLGTLHELLDGADVLVHGYRPHALDRFGLTAEAIADRHPGLVVVSLSAWGDSGPWGDRRGFDSIVQAASGIALAEGNPAKPGAMPCQLLDHGTGYLCAAAVLGSLAAQLTGGGTHVRTLSLARTSHWLLSQPPAQPLATPAPAATPPADGTWLCTVDSSDGPVTTVSPPGELNGRGFTWRHPLSRYGTDGAAWA